MYVSVQDDDKILIFTMDAGTGKLTPKGEAPVSGGPSPLTISPDRKVLYVGHRNVPGISSFQIDPGTGELTQSGTVSPGAAPTFVSTDRPLLGPTYMKKLHFDLRANGVRVVEEVRPAWGAKVYGGSSRYQTRKAIKLS